MKLQEIAYVVGDSGMHYHLDKAIRNMEHHGQKHKSAKVRELCTQAAEQLRNHTNNPMALYDDPFSFVKILSNFHGEPDALRISHALITLSSYVPCDND
jgi:hypothetical protein